MEEILAVGKRESNADLMVECRDLGYIKDTDLVLDPTYGLGVFWKKYQPPRLIGSDLDATKSLLGVSEDFTALEWDDDTFDVVVFDPPYKLNGTPDDSVDARYGVGGKYTPVDARHQLMYDGITECTRVLKTGGFLMVKCQDQVSSGRVHWQTDLMTRHAESLGHRKVDALMPIFHRKQPDGRAQRHARRNYSTLLIFKLES